MSNWSDLPSEILDIVFRNCDTLSTDYKEIIKECTLTCRNWRTSAQRIFFSKIIVDFPSDVGSICRVLSESPILKEFVKILQYDIDTYKITDLEHQSYLLSLANLLPRLEECRFDNDTNFLYSSFYNLFVNGKFSSLKCLPFTTTNFDAKCSIINKEDITKIIFQEKYGGNDIEKVSFQKLRYFPKLKEIESNICSSFMDFSESINKTNNDLPLLQTLSFILRGYEDHVLTERISAIQPTVYIKKLRLAAFTASLFIDNDLFMEYLMKKFPNLYCFFIENYESDQCPMIKDKWPSFLITVQFVKYLSRIPDCSVGHIITNQMTPNVIESLYATTTSVDNSDNSSPSLSHRLVLQYKDYGLEYHEEYGLDGYDYDELLRNAFKTYISFKNYPQCRREIRITYNEETFDSLEEQLQLFEQSGRFFDSITIPFFPDYTFVKYIATHCTRLKELIIQGDRQGFASEKEEGLIKNHSLKKITLEGGNLPKQLCPLISEAFPSLKMLLIRYDDTAVQDDENELDHIVIRLPQTSLEHLELIIVDNDCVEFSNGVYIKIATDTAKSKYISLASAGETFDSRFEEKLAEDLKEIDYEDRIFDDDCLTFYIRCKSIEVAIIKYAGKSFELSFDESNVNNDYI